MATAIESEQSRVSGSRTRIGGAGALLAAGALVAFAGVPGILAGLAVAVGWYLAGGPVAFAVGQVAVAVLLSGGGLAPLAVAEAGLFGVLFAPESESEPGRQRFGRFRQPGLSAVFAVGWVVVAVALAWLSARSAVGLGVATVALSAAIGATAYGLHRYQLVALGLAEGSDE